MILAGALVIATFQIISLSASSLAEVSTHQTGVQCREHILHLKHMYCKAKELDQALATEEPTVSYDIFLNPDCFIIRLEAGTAENKATMEYWEQTT